MRRIRDDMYLFCATRTVVGDVIACRTRRISDSCDSIEDAFYLPASELDFLRRKWGELGRTDIAVLCDVGEVKRVAIFYGFMVASASTGLCTVLDLEPDSVATVLREGAIEGMAASDSLLGLAREPRESDGETYAYMLENSRLLSGLEALRLERVADSVEQIRIAARCASDLVGCFVDCETMLDEGNELDGVVFSGRVCAAYLLMSAMLARIYSPDRSFRVTVFYKQGGVRVRAEIEGGEKCFNEMMKFEKNAAACGVFLNTVLVEDTVITELYPFYSDVGLAGVKEGELRINHTLWLEKHFNGRE